MLITLLPIYYLNFLLKERTMSKTIRPNYQALLRMVDIAEKHRVNMSTWLCLDADEDEPTQVTFDNCIDESEQDQMTCDLQKSYDFCETVGCLAGTYTMAYPESIHASSLEDVIMTWDSAGRSAPDGLLNHLGITEAEFKWLFLWDRITTHFYGDGGYLFDRTEVGEVFRHFKNIEKVYPLDSVTTEKAVRRLRRFIYHKLKQEEIHEAWNSRYNTKHSQSENTNYVRLD